MDKLRDFIETLTEQECHELYKMLKTHLEEEVVFVAGPPEPLVKGEDYEEVDGDGFVVCAKCKEGGGKCDGECEPEHEVMPPA